MRSPSVAEILQEAGIKPALLRWGVGGALVLLGLAALIQAATLGVVSAPPRFWALLTLAGLLIGPSLCIANRRWPGPSMERLRVEIEEHNERLETLRQRATTDPAAAGMYVQELRTLVEEVRRLARPRRILFRNVSVDLTASIPMLEQQIAAFEKIRDHRAV